MPETDPALPAAAESVPEPKPAAESFATMAEVVRWLQEQGYAVSKSALDRHVKAGMLPRRGPVASDGRKVASFLLRDVKRYAEDRLICSEYGLTRSQGTEALSRRKLEEETARITAVRRMKEAELAQLEGSLISRARVEEELAARAGLLLSDFENWCHEFGLTIIGFVGGDEQKVPELIQAMMGEIRTFFSRYAEEKEWSWVKRNE